MREILVQVMILILAGVLTACLKVVIYALWIDKTQHTYIVYVYTYTHILMDVECRKNEIIINKNGLQFFLTFCTFELLGLHIYRNYLYIDEHSSSPLCNVILVCIYSHCGVTWYHGLVLL